MHLEPDQIQDFQDRLIHSREICIISHRNPDPDTIGSNLALRLYLISAGKKVHSVCCDPIPPSCRFLAGADNFLDSPVIDENTLIIAVDASSLDQLGFKEKEKLFHKYQKNLVVIDHHLTNTGYGKLNIVASEAASTTLVIFQLLKEIQAGITPDLATCLLCGLYSDTGSFMHANTDFEAFNAAAELTALGARRDLITRYLYKQKSLEQLYLWGKIFSEAVLTRKHVLISAIKNSDFKELHTDNQSLAGAIDYLNTVKGSHITALLTEDQNGNIKGSLRTKRNDIDLTEIAKSLGGGGHTRASGFTIPGHLRKEIHWKIEPGASPTEQ